MSTRTGPNGSRHCGRRIRPSWRRESSGSSSRAATTCPWCEQHRSAAATAHDRPVPAQAGQVRAGRAVVDCGHVFQNPRLSPTGSTSTTATSTTASANEQLDGLFESRSEGVPAAGRAWPRPHADARDAGWTSAPGTGTSRTRREQVLPGHRVRRAGPERGRRAGAAARLDRHGLPRPLHRTRRGLADRYDAVSMFHYLEHTPDPPQQLAAAARVVRPGGVPGDRGARSGVPLRESVGALVDAVAPAAAPALRAIWAT